MPLGRTESRASLALHVASDFAKKVEVEKVGKVPPDMAGLRTSYGQRRTADIWLRMKSVPTESIDAESESPVLSNYLLGKRKMTGSGSKS